MLPEAQWIVPEDHPVFSGHFPGSPILPGVVLLDRVLLHLADSGWSGLWQIAQGKFLRPVQPGEIVFFRFAERAGNVNFVAEIAVDGKRYPVASGVLKVASL